MDNFPLPLKHSSQPSEPGPTLPALPPKQKIKTESKQNDLAEVAENTEEDIEDNEEELAKKYPPVVDQPPQCDWHLSALMAGKYPDPFTLPATHIAKQVTVHEVAAVVEAIYMDADGSRVTDNDDPKEQHQ